MQIRFYATLRAAAGGKLIKINAAQPTTVRAILHTVGQHKPKLVVEIFDEQGNLRDYIKVLVNGRMSEYLPDGIDTLVSDTDELDVFPPVGGGA